MRYREPFCVFPRKLNSGRIVYYYQTYDENGKRTAGRSAGAITVREARWYCMKLYRAGTLGKPIKRPVTFAEYSVGWWDLNTCEYLKSRNARRQISSSYGRQAKRNLEKYILPAFGRKRLDEITSYAIDTWMVSKLDKGWSGSSVNLMFTVLKVMLRHAVKKGLIAKNPCDEVERVAVRKHRIEIFKPEEVRRLFAPGSVSRLWVDDVHCTLNMLAATTGMRLGEILGLRACYVHEDYIEVAKQFNGYGEYTDTKTHDVRCVTIPRAVASGLARLKERIADGYLFSTDGGKRPTSRAAVYDHFYRALSGIGIDQKERERRGLTFHKWRHFFNTTLRIGNVADSRMQALTGHKSVGMLDLYTHFDPRSFDDVRSIQESMVAAAEDSRAVASQDFEVRVTVTKKETLSPDISAEREE